MNTIREAAARRPPSSPRAYIFEYTGPQVRGNVNLGHLNPQTQEFAIKAKRKK